MSKMGKTCGSNGGVTDRNKPCKWTRGLDKDGRCYRHPVTVDPATKADKKRALELLRDPLNTVAMIADEIGCSIWKMYQWRKRDEQFDKQWMEIRGDVEEVRTDLVEDNMFIRATKGNANPAESIFWLKNRRSQRWKDKQEKELYGKDGSPLLPIEAVRECLEDVPPDELL